MNLLTFRSFKKVKFYTSLSFLFFFIKASTLLGQDKITLTVKTCHVDYQRPAHLDDALEVYSWIVKVGGASLHGEQKIKCHGNELVNIQIKLACMNIHGKPTRLPNKLRSTLNTLCST